MRDACRPAARATATGAALSHSYWPPACTYTSATPCTIDAALAPAEPISTRCRRGGPERRARSPGAWCATPRSAGRPAKGGVDGATGGGDGRRGQRDSLRRKGNRSGDQLAGLPQRDVYRPVVAAEFGELTRAVERVDDPHPVGGQPDGVVDAFFRQHRVAGTFGRQCLHQEVVGALVPGGFSFTRGSVGKLVAHLQQQPARLGGQT